MRIIVLAQDEPVLMAPYLTRVIEARRDDVVAVGLAPLRGTGGAPRNRREAWERTRTLLQLFEPAHFAKFLAIRSAWRAAPRLFPRRSLRAVAKRLQIPVLDMVDPNRSDFLDRLERLKPDVILNQSELLLRRPLLDLPRIGVINRHGSRLPDHRGRLGSFWQHYEDGDAGAFWVTVHFVDEGLDTGDLILQRAFPIAPGASYGHVIERLFEESAGVVLEAFHRLEEPVLHRIANPADAGSSHRHPTLEDARKYRRLLAVRRAGRQDPAQ